MTENLFSWIVGRSGWVTAQYLSDILSGAPDKKLKTALTDFINILLNGELPLPVRETLDGVGLLHSRKRTAASDPSQ